MAVVMKAGQYFAQRHPKPGTVSRQHASSSRRMANRRTLVMMQCLLLITGSSKVTLHVACRPNTYVDSVSSIDGVTGEGSGVRTTDGRVMATRNGSKKPGGCFLATAKENSAAQNGIAVQRIRVVEGLLSAGALLTQRVKVCRFWEQSTPHVRVLCLFTIRVDFRILLLEESSRLGRNGLRVAKTGRCHGGGGRTTEPTRPPAAIAKVARAARASENATLPPRPLLWC